MAESDKNKDINITYDTLFELLRREKNREDMQQLPESFFFDVVSYLREKDNIIRKANDDENIFPVEEKEKTRNQLENVKKIIKELYERRERKLMEMAVFKSRTNSNLINTSNLLKEEKALFESLVKELNRFRKGILMSILNASEPFVEMTTNKNFEVKKSLKVEISEPKSISEAENNGENPKEGFGSSEKHVAKLESINTTVKFTSHVPKFVGRELEVYGPFEPEDVANLPKQIADILVRKGRAEEIKMN